MTSTLQPPLPLTTIECDQELHDHCANTNASCECPCHHNTDDEFPHSSELEKALMQLTHRYWSDHKTPKATTVHKDVKEALEQHMPYPVENLIKSLVQDVIFVTGSATWDYNGTRTLILKNLSMQPTLF